MKRFLEKIHSSRFRDIQKELKVQILNEVALIQVVRLKGLVFKIARTKIHQNFLALKYDIKLHSDAI